MSTLIKRPKNLWAKSRTIDKPYLEITSGEWTWRILKAYQCRKLEAGNEYARYFCAVRSPCTQGSWDMGDTYVEDIPHDQKFYTAMEDRIIAEAEATIGA